MASFKPRRRAPRRRPARKTARKPSAALKAAIVSVVKRQSETKFASTYSGQLFPNPCPIGASGNNGHNGTINGPQDIHALVPPIGYGPEYYQRVGTRISPLSLYLQLDVSIGGANTFPVNPENLMVVMYILSCKDERNYADLNANNRLGTLIKDGQGGVQGFNATAINAKCSVNDDVFTLHKKLTFPLRCSGYSGALPPSTIAVTQNMNSAPFARRFNMNLTKYLPKKLEYSNVLTGNAIVDDNPINSTLFMCFGFYDQTLGPTPSGTLIEVNYQTTIKYKDA